MVFSLSSFVWYIISLVVNWINVGKLPIIINSGVYIIFFADTLLAIIVHSNDSGKKHEMETMKDERKNTKENEGTYRNSYLKYGRNCESVWMYQSKRKYNKSIWSLFSLSDDGQYGLKSIKNFIQILKLMLHPVEQEKVWQMHWPAQ